MIVCTHNGAHTHTYTCIRVYREAHTNSIGALKELHYCVATERDERIMNEQRGNRQKNRQSHEFFIMITLGRCHLEEVLQNQ